MTSFIVAFAMIAFQPSSTGGLGASLERDIDAAIAAGERRSNVAAEEVPGAGGAAINATPPPPPSPPPPPPPPPPLPPAPNVFGANAAAEKLTLSDERWIRIGSLPSRSPLLRNLISGATGLPPLRQAAFVQSIVSRQIAYRTDQDNWGARDYWASADETMARRAGDCEDSALVKLQALRQLGFPERDLYLMAGYRASGEEHALLIVRVDNHFWVLDDGAEKIASAEVFKSFRPAYSYSAGWKWTHEVPGKVSDSAAGAMRR